MQRATIRVVLGAELVAFVLVMTDATTDRAVGRALQDRPIDEREPVRLELVYQILGDRLPEQVGVRPPVELEAPTGILQALHQAWCVDLDDRLAHSAIPSSPVSTNVGRSMSSSTESGAALR